MTPGAAVPTFADTTTRQQALDQMARAFAAAGFETPKLDARFLLQGLLRIDGAALLTSGAQALGTDAARMTDAVKRRLAHEPVARILGQRDFYGRTFTITPDVLDPRADTETCIDLALALLRASDSLTGPVRVADIGTGSGILLATLLAELPQATGLATDVSAPALAVAQHNAERLGVASRAAFRCCRGLPADAGRFDLVLSNPPYIETGALPGLDRAVRDFDPALALDGGTDGLEIYREISIDVARLGVSLVILELGAGQLPAVTGIFADAGYRPAGQQADLGGHARAGAFQLQ